MYNGIGLNTPRGSGTNGHVQRNWAFVRPGKKDNSNYRSEEDIKKLDASLNRPPNKDILDHDRKRKIEVKCLEFEEILEKQGLASDEIKAKVDSYRQKLMGQGKTDLPKDEFGRITVRDTHQIAEAQQEKNAKLREAFNISEYFVEGSSFDSDRKAKEELAKSLALQKELDAQREQAAAAAAKEKESSKRYALVRTPSIERDVSLGGIGGGGNNDDHTIKKKKKKRTRESSVSPDRKKEKKKKSKKRKKESKSKKSKKLRKRSESDSNVENDKDSNDEDSDTDSETDIKKSRKKSKKEKKKRDKKNKKKELSSSSEKSRSTSPVDKHMETKKESKNSETTTGKKSSGNPFRNRSKEKSNKPKESRRRKRERESSEESHNRRSRSRNDRDLNKRRSLSNKGSRNRRSRSRIERDSRSDRCHDGIRGSYLKCASSYTDYHGRERNDKDYYIRDREHEREIRTSQSRQRSRRDNTDIRFRDHKRKLSEERSQRKRDSLSVEKRMKYSRSPSHSRSRQSRDKKSYPRTTQKKRNSSRTRSRTPRHNYSDPQQSKRGVNQTRSRSSSVNENVARKSLTPPPRKSNINSLSNEEKIGTNSSKSVFKDTKPTGRKSRSRTTSSSSSDSGSSIDTESSRSRTPSPKIEHLEKPSVSICTDTEKPSSRRTKSPSLRGTPSPVMGRSKHLLNEKSAIDNQLPVSRSRESREESKEKKEEHKQFASRTPPPYRVEKKELSTRSSRDSSELSYSPARRNPERYRDILETSRNQRSEKRKDEDRKEHTKSTIQCEEREKDRKEKGGRNDRNQAKPVVRLQSQSEDESDSTERNAEKLLDEFQESKRERELKDFKMLEQLKTGIAAKAKEKIKTIEKMAASTSTGSSANNGGEPLVAALADSSLVDAIVSKVSTATVAAAESAARRSRSRSRRSRSRNRREEKTNSGVGSNSGGGGGGREGNRRRSTSHSRSSRSSSSSRSRTRSHSRRSSCSHSSQSSSSSRSSSRSSSSSSFGSSRSGTRSPSIPRRRGSPSFLDRRRITSRHSSSRDRRH